ncbi:hypothetical protein SESBI_05535 [Sesbania bispinosa]|nr:hypothetical protein SESBI_05535 [Sesbania bispinosa]
MEAEHDISNGIGSLYVKVMTDEQMELLRQQISVYTTMRVIHHALAFHQHHK